MKSIIQPSSKNTPEISFDNESLIFEVNGISTPVNAFEYYQGIVAWIELNESMMADGTVFHFNMPYFNSATMKAVLILLERIKKGIMSGKKWTIDWFIEEDDEFMLDAAESFQRILELEFRISS